jgi:hypothetical protein
LVALCIGTMNRSRQQSRAGVSPAQLARQRKRCK